MKLPVLLKEAIIEGNWEKVCFIYTAITGEEISPPKPTIIEKEKTEEEILKDLDLEPDIKIKREEKANFIATTKKEESSNDDDYDGKKIARKTPFIKHKIRPQLFTDDRTEAVDDLTENNQTLAKMYVSPRERNRSNNLVKVECSICGKTLEVSSVLATTYDPDPSENSFKCDNCIVKRR
jgi:hypothetical protein